MRSKGDWEIHTPTFFSIAFFFSIPGRASRSAGRWACLVLQRLAEAQGREAPARGVREGAVLLDREEEQARAVGVPWRQTGGSLVGRTGLGVYTGEIDAERAARCGFDKMFVNCLARFRPCRHRNLRVHLYSSLLCNII